MALFYNNGSPAMSFSPLAAAGTTSFAEVSEPAHQVAWYRIGGSNHISMGLGLMIDTLEPRAGFGGGGSAGTAKAPSTSGFLDGTGRPDFWGRQVVVCDSDVIANITATYTKWVGVFTGLVAVAGGGYGFNFVGDAAVGSATTPFGTSDASDRVSNGFTYLGATAAPCVDPLNGGRSYAKFGDIIAVRRQGPAIAWVSDVNATAADSIISMGGVNAPVDGTLSAVAAASAAYAVGVTLVNPTAFDADGTGMGCQVWLK